jgi:DNA topoisomerase-3
LSAAERNVYELVARQYLIQFYPPHEYCDSQIDLNICGGHFIARARESLTPGWKQLFPPRKDRGDEGGDRQEAALNRHLPTLSKGDHCNSEQADLLEKQTSPPKPFDDASLLAAMTGIARYVQDPEIRKVLKDTDGLGTEATRAGIIELLFSREFLQRRGKQILSTTAGRALIHSLPAIATTPDMTAHWETQLNAISQRAASYKGFMQPLECSLQALIDHSQLASMEGLKELKSGVGAGRKPHRKSRRKPARKPGKKQSSGS